MTGFDPIEMLRRADPLDPLEVPTDTTGAHARALFQEVTSMDAIEQETRPVRKQPLKRKLALGVAMAVVATAVAGGAYALLRDKADEVIVGGEPLGGGGMASCIRYSDEQLLTADFAFDGTLVSGNEDGTQATFEVHEWYRGGEGDTVTLNAEGMLGYGPIALIGLSMLENQRYLISGVDGHVNACGYSVTYDTAIASHWAEIFAA
jgi:hypothetical protein